MKDDTIELFTVIACGIIAVSVLLRVGVDPEWFLFFIAGILPL